MNSVRVYVALGSNLGSRSENLTEALRRMADIGNIIQQSAVYDTKPQYVTDQPPFLNQVVLFKTAALPLDLLDAFKKIEMDMGREPGLRYGPRLIDLDILYYDTKIINHPRITIPHPEIAKRDFVLRPLAEIAPDFLCPLHHKTIVELFRALNPS